jgi:hypothetical protein
MRSRRPFKQRFGEPLLRLHTVRLSRRSILVNRRLKTYLIRISTPPSLTVLVSI